MSSTIWNSRPISRANGAVGLERRARDAAQQGGAGHRGLDQATGLQGVQLAQLVVVAGGGGHVHVLAADHALHAGGPGHLGQRAEHARGLALLAVGDQAEGLGEQAVAGQDGDVLAERDVAGGQAAAQAVVVDGRQVVVDQRVGVDELEGGGEGQDARERRAAARSATARLSTGRIRLPPASSE